MTTGSSIMPQKRNYDVCELVRAKISVFFGYADQMRNLSTHLIGGYQRDLQMTKSILLRAWDLWREIVEIVTLVATELQSRTDRLEAAMTPDLFATARVYALVSAGMGFRDAYHMIKKQEAAMESE
jgi:argininosuccinate lyase